MKIKIIGPVCRTDGYGSMAREVVFGLLENDIVPSVRSILFGGEQRHYRYLNEEIKKLDSYITEEWNGGRFTTDINNNCDVTIQCLTPENFPIHCVPGKLNIGYTMWETSKLPEHWIKLCNQMDIILTPSEFSKNVFVQSGVTKPVIILPIGTDPAKFDNVEKNNALDELINGRFVFYSIFQWSERKNPAALLNSYYSSFSSSDKTALIIKTYLNNDSDYNKSEITNRIKIIKGNIRRGKDDYPKVIAITDHTTNYHLLQMHKAGHVYVAPVRGEGWCLPAFDSAMCGNSVITTAGQSSSDFLDTYSYFKFQLYDFIPYQEDFVHDMGGIYTPDQKWAEINTYELSKRMRQKYEQWLESKFDYDKQFRDEWSQQMRKIYDRKRVARKLLDIVNGKC